MAAQVAARGIKPISQEAPMRILVVLLALAAALPRALEAQALDAVMEAVRDGGGWVSIPIEAGRGSASTLPIPTMGLTLTGCLRVWDGHSGRWEIRARDIVGQTSLSVSSAPGEGVPFSHTFGLRSQLEVDVHWSEPRDTTLFLWVGLKGTDDDRDACLPKI
ncbi:MAG TPA: hypothetical protein VLA09_07495 [Longimicrobiales bacterium]|nr:hypothetical protein [Longimicrobiales bacterium]